MPLDSALQGRMERGFGEGFGEIRVHQDGEAARFAQSVQARAVGGPRDIAFSAGGYRPGTPETDVLVAHELAHVVERRRRPEPAAATIGTRSREATATAAGLRALRRGGPTQGADWPNILADDRRLHEVAHATASQQAPMPDGNPLRLERCSATPTREYAPQLRADAPAAVPPFPRGDVPGEISEFRMNYDDAYQEAAIDGDGDQFKELLVRVRRIDNYPNGKVRTVRIQLQPRSDSGARRSADFTLPDDWHGTDYVIPRIDRNTNGRDPTVINLGTDWGLNPLHIYPPTVSGGTATYALEVGTKRTDVSVPSSGPPRRVFQAGAVAQAGGIYSIDATVGAYNDRFRFTFQSPDPASTTVLMGVSVLSGDSPEGGTQAQLTVNGTLRPAIVAGSGIGLAIDLNGDGSSDLEVWDRMYAVPDYTSNWQAPGPAQERREHLMTLTGTSRPSGGWFMFKIEKGKVEAGAATENTFAPASAAAASSYLRSQAVPTSVQNEVRQLETMLDAERSSAYVDHLIERDLYISWLTMSTDVLQIRTQLEMGGAVSPVLQFQAAADAGKFYDALAAATASAVQLVENKPPWGSKAAEMGDIGPIQTLNPYTEEFRTYDIFVNRSNEPGARLMGDIVRGDWPSALDQYRRLLNGMDRWIADKRTQKDASRGQRIAYLSQLSTQLSRIPGAARPLNAVFHPQSQFVEGGRIVDVPMPLFYWESDGKWQVLSLINPAEAWRLDPVAKEPRQTEPPVSMLRQLNNKYKVPPGFIYYQFPGGSGGRIEVTSEWTWVDYTKAIGLGLAAIGLIMVTAGAGTSVAVAGAYVLAASGVVSAVGAAGDLYERAQAQALDATSVTLDLLQIVGGLAGATALVSGRIIISATRAAAAGRAYQGLFAYAARGADIVYLPAAATAAGTAVLTVPVLTADAVKQVDAIRKGPLSPDQQRNALLVLFGNLALSAGMAVLSVRGVIPEFNRGPNLRLEFAEVPRPIGATGEPVLVAVALPATTEAGAAIAGARVAPTMATSEAEFQAAAARRLDVIRAQAAGPEGAALARVEEQALKMQWRFEETRRVLEPLVGEATQAARTAAPSAAREAVLRGANKIVDLCNNPALSNTARQQAIRAELANMETAVRGTNLATLDFVASRAAVDNLTGTASSGVLVTDASGNLTMNGRAAGTINSLFNDIATANRTNFANGVDTEYIVNIGTRNAAGRGEVQVITRPRALSIPPRGVPAPLPGLPEGVAGRYVVEIGAGGGSYAVDMVPQAEQASSLLVQTEVGSFATAAQARRDLQAGLQNVAPRSGPNSIVVLGDALQNMELVFGTPARGGGVRRLIINNVNANYGSDQYAQLARGLRQSMARGGRIEVQWDLSPESAGGPPRNHIRGDLLGRALRDQGASIGYNDRGPAVPYPSYDVTPPKAAEPGKVVPQRPDPTSATGRRAVITFQ